MNSMNRLNDMHTKFYLWHFLLIVFISFFLTTFVKADEYSDIQDMGLFKEKIDTIYLELLEPFDYIEEIDVIIEKLETNSINKKEAMSQGLQLINTSKEQVDRVQKKLENLEPLVLSSQMKDKEIVFNKAADFFKK